MTNCQESRTGLRRRNVVAVLGSAWLPLTYAVAGAAPASPPPLMLAKQWDDRLDTKGFLISEKYDGMRGYWDGQRLLTRAGNPIAAPAWFTAGWPNVPMDGELWAGRGRFSDAVSTARDQTPDDAAWRKVRYMVFDLPGDTTPFAQRATALQTLVRQLQQLWVQAVVQTPASTAATLRAQLLATVNAGGEGLVLHRGSANYSAGRSDDLRKLKPLDDAEGVVVGHVAGRGKYAGQMGALWLELPAAAGQAPRRFKLGTGFSDTQRRNPPPLGSSVSFRYRGETESGLPRFASFWRMALPHGL